MPRPLSRKRLKKLKAKARKLLLEGKSVQEILQELPQLSIFHVTGLTGPMVKEGLLKRVGDKLVPTKQIVEIREPIKPERKEAEGEGEGRVEGEGVRVPSKPEKPQPIKPVATEFKPPSLRVEAKELRTPSRPTLEPEEVLLEVEGVPPTRRVKLTPKSLMWYAWFRTKYNYSGDLSTFINEVIEDFFRSRGWTIKIVKEEEFA